jgi:hypothetical protein
MDTWLAYRDLGTEERLQGGRLVRKLPRKITEVVLRLTGPGATLNAWHEVDRAASSIAEVDAQLHRVSAASSQRAA